MAEQLSLASKLTTKATPVILPEEIEKNEFLGVYTFFRLRDVVPCFLAMCLLVAGSGQFGSVWRGTCRGMPVAIKYLENFNTDKLRDFLDEVQIMSKVLNPHVVLLLGACTTGPINEWCMVTELCSRGDLEYLLYNSDTKLSLKKKFSFAIDICLGLSWLNGKEMKVTHHDLKPANGMTESFFC
jgi:serine/threonine protein kinase